MNTSSLRLPHDRGYARDDRGHGRGHDDDDDALVPLRENEGFSPLNTSSLRLPNDRGYARDDRGDARGDAHVPLRENVREHDRVLLPHRGRHFPSHVLPKREKR